MHTVGSSQHGMESPNHVVLGTTQGTKHWYDSSIFLSAPDFGDFQVL